MYDVLWYNYTDHTSTSTILLFKHLQAFPGNLLPCTYQNSDNVVCGRTEVERRKEHTDIMEAEFGRLHQDLVLLVKQCLHNAPEKRPSTDELLSGVKKARNSVEGKYGCPVKLDMEKVKLAKEIRIKDQKIDQLMKEKVNYIITMQ